MFDFIFKFPSLTDTQHGYTVNQALHHYTGGWQGMSHRAGMFWHGGDGLTLHSPYCAVPMDRFVDYFGSLCFFLLEGNNLDKYGTPVSSAFSFIKVDERLMDFVFSLKTRSDKRVFYSLSELKTSTSDTKRDRRSWEELDYAYKGRAWEVFALLSGKLHPNGLMDSFHLYQEIRDYASRTNHWLDENKTAADYFAVPGPAGHAERVYRALRCLVESQRKKETATRILERLKEESGREAAA